MSFDNIVLKQKRPQFRKVKVEAFDSSEASSIDSFEVNLIT